LTPEREPTVSTAEAAEKLSAFGDEEFGPKAGEFARYLPGYLKAEVTPQGMVMAGSLASLDLERGINGYTGERIDSPLVGAGPAEPYKLLAALPGICERVFPEDFSEAVKMEIKKMLGDKYETAVRANEMEREVITSEITNVDDAKRLIVDDALEKVLAVDWKRFGVTEEQAREIFGLYPLLLRQAAFQAPITAMIDEPSHERGLLMELPDEQKTHLFKQFWLGMTIERIDPEEATLTRDHLFLKGVEVIAGMSDLDVPQVMQETVGLPEIQAASLRMIGYMRKHPERFRELPPALQGS
jgi:hypothetical protein